MSTEPITGGPEAIAQTLRGLRGDRHFANVQVWLEPNTLGGINAFPPALDLAGCLNMIDYASGCPADHCRKRGPQLSSDGLEWATVKVEFRECPRREVYEVRLI